MIPTLKLTILLLFFGFSHTYAHHLLDNPTLACDSVFPCPEELQGRIHFWASVFQKYDDTRLIFHDARVPERLYSVIESRAKCGRRRRRGAWPVQNERNRIRNLLYAIAKKLNTKNPTWTLEEEHILKMFPQAKPQDLRRAGKHIRCQEGNQERFSQGLERFEQYQDMVLKTLRRYGLPEDIQFLPFVESSYNPKAYSRLGAAGLWQIMPRTARRLGLKLNATVDERFDPRASTEAAAKYLQNAYQELHQFALNIRPQSQLGSIGPFVITSYNYGTAGMRRAIRQIGPDFVDVLNKYSGRRFRVAVQNFYTSFLAARHVAKNAKTYFQYQIQPQKPKPVELILVRRSVSARKLSEATGISLAELRELNPSLTKRVWRGWRRIPKGFIFRLPVRRNGWDATLISLWDQPPAPLQVREEKYRVRRGDTPCGIARTFGVFCRDFIEANDLGPRAIIRIGQIVTIPGKASRPPRIIAKKPLKKIQPTPIATATPRLVSSIEPEKEEKTAKEVQVYGPPAELVAAFGLDKDLFVQSRQESGKIIHFVRVELEETLGHYADWLGIGIAQPLRRLNNRRIGQPLKVGEEIQLPIRNENAKKDFESNRIEYHKTLEEEFLSQYKIAGQETYTVERGDSAIRISTKLQVPVWLLKRFNPKLFEKSLQVGDQLKVPVIQKQSEKTS